MVAEILQQADLSRRQRAAGGAGRLSDAVGGEADLSSHQLAECRGDRPQAELRLRLALRPAAVGGQQQCRAGLGQLRDRRQRCLQPSRVSNPAVGQRDVEVDTNEDAYALEVAEIQIFQREEVFGVGHGGWPHGRFRVGPKVAPGRRAGPHNRSRCRTRRRYETVDRRRSGSAAGRRPRSADRR